MTEILVHVRWYSRVSGLPSFALMQPGQEEARTSWKSITKEVGLELNLTDSDVIVLLSANTTGAGVAEYDIRSWWWIQLPFRAANIIGGLGVHWAEGTHSRGQCHLTWIVG